MEHCQNAILHTYSESSLKDIDLNEYDLDLKNKQQAVSLDSLGSKQYER